MAATVKDRGNYELFDTDQGHRILVLNGEQWFAWVEGQEGELLVRSDSDHRKDHTVQKGYFYLAEFDNDPRFQNNQPHLFLQNGDHFQEFIVPNGLPTGVDDQKKVVSTDDNVAKDELTDHLEH